MLLRENRKKETADLSTALRSGRDDKFVGRWMTFFPRKIVAIFVTNMSSRPEHSAVERSAVSFFLFSRRVSGIFTSARSPNKSPTAAGCTHTRTLCRSR